MQSTLQSYSEIHFVCPFGSDWQTTFNITSGTDDSGADIPVDITSWVITIDFKTEPNGASILTENGVILDGANGIYNITIDKDTLANNLSPNIAYYYTIMEDDGGGNEFIRYMGTFTLVLPKKNKIVC